MKHIKSRFIFTVMLILSVLATSYSGFSADSTWIGNTELNASWHDSSNWSTEPGEDNRVLIGVGSSENVPVELYTAPATNIVWDTYTETNITSIVTNWVGDVIDSIVTNTTEDVISFASTNILENTEFADSLLINEDGALRITGEDPVNRTLEVAGNISQIGYGSSPGSLFIEEGGYLLSINRAVRFGNSSTSPGFLKMSGGRLRVQSGEIAIGNEGEGTAVLTESSLMETVDTPGGTSTSSNLRLGVNKDARGFFYATNSTISLSYAHLVGVNGYGYMELVNSTNSAGRQLYAGRESTATGIVDFISGRAFYSYDVIIGDKGFGKITLKDNFDFNGRGFYVGNETTGKGIVEINASTIRQHNGYAMKIGLKGHGELWMLGASVNNDRVAHTVRESESGFGLIRGYGRFVFARNTATPLFINNGLVVADGFGEEQDLDLSGINGSSASHPAQMDNTIENDSTNGWYAVKKGRLRMNISTMRAASGGIMTWGENPADDEIDLVNSARFVFTDGTWENKTVTGSLYATDRTDIPDVETLSVRGSVSSIWDFTTSVAAPYKVDLHVRYDHSLVGSMKPVLLKHTGSGWQKVATEELSGYRLEANDLDSLGWFAVVAAPHATLLIAR